MLSLLYDFRTRKGYYTTLIRMYPEHFVSTTWIQSKKNTTFKHAKKVWSIEIKKVWNYSFTKQNMNFKRIGDIKVEDEFKKKNMYIFFYTLASSLKVSMKAKIFSKFSLLFSILGAPTS